MKAYRYLAAKLPATLMKWLRYASVSVVSTVTSLTVLGVLVGLADAPAGWSNVAATVIATVPSFELNRRWVWSKRGQRAVLGEVMPFATLSMIGLGLSTLAIHFVSSWALGWGWSRLARTAAVEFANVGTFGILWVFQFVMCDRVLFRSKALKATQAPRPTQEHRRRPAELEPAGEASSPR